MIGRNTQKNSISPAIGVRACMWSSLGLFGKVVE